MPIICIDNQLVMQSTLSCLPDQKRKHKPQRKLGLCYLTNEQIKFT